MAVTSDGWLDWAIRLPGRPNLNPGTSSVRGIFMHSAEGYAPALLDPSGTYSYNGQFSWHLTNMTDGRLFQHHPFTARCKHATAANQEYVGVENEGYHPREKSLSEPQIENAVRFISDISEWKGWEPKRPVSKTDTTHTLWEHNEVVRLGGSGSACPSGRIPWDEILSRLQEDDDMYHQHDGWGLVGLTIPAGQEIRVNARDQFGIPPQAKRIDVELLQRGYVVVKHGNTGAQAGRGGWSSTPGVADGYAPPVTVELDDAGNFILFAEDPKNPPYFFNAHATAWY